MKNCKNCLHFGACSKWTDFPMQCGFPVCAHFDGWISVEERLPDPNEYDWVLVAYTFNEDGTYGVPTVAELRKDGKWWDLGSEFSLEEKFCTVTHWMPLPEFPKGEQE